MNPLHHFKEVWAGDFEFNGQTGERPSPVCFVARELFSNRMVRLWQDQLRQMNEPPFPTDPDTLFVAYDASAEMGCFLALG